MSTITTPCTTTPCTTTDTMPETMVDDSATCWWCAERLERGQEAIRGYGHLAHPDCAGEAQQVWAQHPTNP